MLDIRAANGILLISVALLCGCSSLAFHRDTPSSKSDKTRKAALSSTTASAGPQPPPATGNARAEPSGLWQQLIFEARLNYPKNDAIAAERDLLLKQAQRVARGFSNAAPYLFYIASEIRTRQLPSEIAILPILESWYRADALSPQGAAGLWQLMAHTARRYDLTVDRWHDERLDVQASTVAALNHIEVLRDRFAGDWSLVLAAYNAGEGAVERAINRNIAAALPTDFWSLSLPAETTRYVPRFWALVAVALEASNTSVAIADLPPHAPSDLVTLSGPLDLTRVAALSKRDPSRLAALNPALRRMYIPSGRTARVYLPIDSAQPVIDAVAALPAEDRGSPRTYTVRAGDTLSTIAFRMGASTQDLKRANRLRTARIYPGQELIIPPPGHEAVPPAGSQSIYEVRAGDTLWDIAKLLGVPVRELERVNPGIAPRKLRPGTQINVPAPSRAVDEQTPVMEGANDSYRVQSGDSLWTIARQFNVSVPELRKWNAIEDLKPLQPGQKLIVTTPGADDS
ncbi:MAG: LysM peptidoglycan-binding domain-containing protein [Pseudomonadota bacterium]